MKISQANAEIKRKTPDSMPCTNCNALELQSLLSSPAAMRAGQAAILTTLAISASAPRTYTT